VLKNVKYIMFLFRYLFLFIGVIMSEEIIFLL